MKINIDDLYYFDETFKMHYYFAKTKKQYNSIIKKVGIDSNIKGISGRNLTYKNINGQMISIIYAKNGKPEVLAHECVHAGIFLLNFIEQEIRDDEVLPCIVEALVRNFNKILRIEK
jgi:hypothetical protein